MTVGQTPPGWYDDGRGQLRYFDGNAWTEHVHPLPQATPPAPAPPAQPVAPAAPAAPVAPAAPAAPAAGVPAAATLGGAAATQTVAAKPAEPPIYRKPWFIGAVIIALLALAGAAYALTSGSDDAGTGTTATPTATGSVGGGATGGTTGGASFYGQEPSAVAAKANCTVGAVIPVQTTPPTQGALPKAATTCMLNGTSYTVVTWNAAPDQDNPASLANAFTPPITAGTKYYATGAGWTAFDPTYTQASAQAFATAAGGSVKSVVVVTSSSAPTAQ